MRSASESIALAPARYSSAHYILEERDYNEVVASKRTFTTTRYEPLTDERAVRAALERDGEVWSG